MIFSKVKPGSGQSGVFSDDGTTEGPPIGGGIPLVPASNGASISIGEGIPFSNGSKFGSNGVPSGLSGVPSGPTWKPSAGCAGSGLPSGPNTGIPPWGCCWGVPSGPTGNPSGDCCNGVPSGPNGMPSGGPPTFWGGVVWATEAPINVPNPTRAEIQNDQVGNEYEWTWLIILK